jgi:hypothetical protein
MRLLGRNEGVFFQHGRATSIALFLALGFALIAIPVQAAIRYVDHNGVNNAGACDTPATACDSITYAISQANSTDEIRVAKGTYTEGQITVNKAVIITGGFDPTNPGTLWDTTNYTFTPTILDGQGTSRVLTISINNVVLQFMTIENGNATAAAPSQHEGGGILVANADDVMLNGLTLQNNIASMTSPTSIGGAIALVGNSDVDIERSVIVSNSAVLGGGIGTDVPNAATTNVEIRNSLIAHNSAGEGGALATTGDGRSLVSFFHTTFGDNNRGTPGAQEAIFMTNGDAVSANSLNFTDSLLTGNATAVVSNLDKTPSMMSTNVMIDTNVTNDWVGNIPIILPADQRELLFVDPDARDYHLSALSPAIDLAGSTLRTDLDGHKRDTSVSCTSFAVCPLGRSEDMGAYEYVYTAPVARHVANEGDDDRNCLNPDFPCKTLERANALSLGRDEIRVAHGTYTEGDGSCATADAAVICMHQGITITGGFTLTNWITASTNPVLTVLDGTDIRRGIMADYDVPTASSIIQNLTIRNGNSNGIGGGNGGGIAVNTQNVGPAQNLTIRNCRVENSRGDSSGDGGGIFARSPVNLRVSNCRLSGNSVPDGRGGGLAIADATGTATYTLTSLNVFGNLADRPDDQSANGGRGGGIFLEGVGTLRQSEVYSNSAAFSGGGVSTGSNGAHPTLNRLYIHDNRAGVGGGFSIFLTGGANLYNSLLVRNVATSTVGLVSGQTAEPVLGGNAIHTPYVGVAGEPLRVINVTIADNDGAVQDAVTVEGVADGASSRRNFFTNVLISGNEVGIRSDGEGFAELAKVLMTTDITIPTANFDASRLSGTPLSGAIGFVGNGDYHLVPGADGVDDGDTVAEITADLDGVTRPVGPAYDIGAYETTLEKQNQTITFAPIPNKALAESPFAVNPTASSGLPVQVTSQTPVVCTVIGAQVTLLAEGTCTLQANQPGNTIYNPAPTVTRSFEVGTVAPQMELRLPALSKE